MNILLVHQNFPGQFKHLAPVLGASADNSVVAFSMLKSPPSIPGVATVSYRPGRGTHRGTHPWVQDFESKVIRGGVAMKAARKMRDEYGFAPDVIFAHHGWGESLFLKEIWPRAKMLVYTEWYYSLHGGDIGFDPEFQENDEEALARLRLKNAHNLLSMEMADAALSPTQWQADSHPAWFRDRISVIHDGIDTRAVAPRADNPPLRLVIPADPDCAIAGGEVVLSPGEEIVTFINRNLEPYRGYHIFMRALPDLLRRRPQAKVVIVGGNETSYGARPETGTWKQRFLDEVRPDIDLSRVYFPGKIPYSAFLALMQMTTVHVYLTYPFVLSWSLLEAMACGAAVVASDTAPVREAVTEGQTGRLVGFFEKERLIDTVCELLEDREQRQHLGAAARRHIVEHYDLRTRCLPRQLALINEVASL
ncbi:MAG: glycosyltransferase family 4 protein [Novosphingobium sp.]|nr:glycosyltransferase family 4 protein [Novosphingobium sp.]